jgi:hypothetical protein
MPLTYRNELIIVQTSKDSCITKMMPYLKAKYIILINYTAAYFHSFN